MLVATYNIQWGKGRDGRVDLDRIAKTIEAADLIGLQEVERNWREMEHADEVARLSELLPDRHIAFASAVDVDGSTRRKDGTIVQGRRQYGMMVLSRWPISSIRTYPLRKYPVHGSINDTGVLLETVIAHPSKPIRFYNTHLNYLSQRQRLLQAKEILAFINDAPRQGGVVVGPGVPDDHFGADWMMLESRDVPPMPQPALLVGDFNMRPDSEEYAMLTGPIGPDYGRIVEHGMFADALTLAGLPENAGTTFPAKDGEAACRIDHIFVSSDIAGTVKRSWIDEKADGSDHQPVFAELDW